MITAVVPVKDLDHAKERLGALLTPPERRRLARAMLQDVLHALGGSPVDRVLVVTGDEEVIAIARAFAVEVLVETANHGHTAAVAAAQRHLVVQGVDSLLTIPGDVPLVTADEISAIVASSPSPSGATFVPSRSGHGTNGVLLFPPDLLPLKFGEPSFANHLAAAQARGVEPAILSLPGLGLDIDTPLDLQIFFSEPGQTRTAGFLETTGIRARLTRFLAERPE